MTDNCTVSPKTLTVTCVRRTGLVCVCAGAIVTRASARETQSTRAVRCRVRRLCGDIPSAHPSHPQLEPFTFLFDDHDALYDVDDCHFDLVLDHVTRRDDVRLAPEPDNGH